MKIFLTILIILNLCFLVGIYYILKNEKKKVKEKIIKEFSDELEEEYKNKKQQLENKYYSLKEKIRQDICQEEELLKAQQDKRRLVIQKEKENIDLELKNYKIIKEKEIKEQFELEKRKIENETSDYIKYQEQLKEEALSQLSEVYQKLEEQKKIRESINLAILKEEESKNQIDTHRIIISELDKEDIDYLISIEHKIHNKDLLHKLIWSEYLQKPFNQMINNIFGSKVPKNVIYCIENYNTHKKYIGKTSAEVSKRWTEHIKSSLNIGGIKKQKIHEALFNHWDEYTFSILEETTKDKLSEREKYYISFFETDKYGFNLKSGG